MKVQNKQRYIPEGYVLMAKDEAVGLEVYRDPNRLVAIGYAGKRMKPDFNYRFQSEERLEKYVMDYVVDIMAVKVLKENRRKEQAERNKNISVQVGDIFRSSWGYEQTNIDYYQVVAVKGQMVEVREIGQQREEDGYLCGKCIPAPGMFIGEPIKARLKAVGDRPAFKVASYADAYKMEPIAVVAGIPMYESSYWSAYA